MLLYISNLIANIPGEKKKHRKESIAARRRERMLRRGVDLEQINSVIEFFYYYVY